MRRGPWLAAGVSALLLSTGCLPVLHGMGHMHGGTTAVAPDSGPPAAGIVQAVQVGRRAVTVDVPPLRVGDEAILTVSVEDGTPAAPQTNLSVTFEISPAGADAHAPEEGPAGERLPAVRRTAALATRPGVYAVTHTFGAPGLARIAVTVAGGEGVEPVTLRLTAPVREPAGFHAGAARPRTPLVILGSVIMAITMAAKFMWL